MNLRHRRVCVYANLNKAVHCLKHVIFFFFLSLEECQWKQAMHTARLNETHVQIVFVFRCTPFQIQFLPAICLLQLRKSILQLLNLFILCVSGFPRREQLNKSTLWLWISCKYAAKVNRIQSSVTVLAYYVITSVCEHQFAECIMQLIPSWYTLQTDVITQV